MKTLFTALHFHFITVQFGKFSLFQRGIILETKYKTVIKKCKFVEGLRFLRVIDRVFTKKPDEIKLKIFVL